MNYLFTETPLKFLVQPFWRDEAFTILLSKKSLLHITFLTAKDFNPPLYYFFLHIWIKIFPPTEIYSRLFSLLLFCISAYFFQLILEKNLKMKGIKLEIYTLFFIFNPLLLYYAFEARMYSLLTLLTLSSTYFFLDKKDKSLIISLTLLLYTHYFSLFYLLSLILYVLYSEKGHTKKIIWKKIKPLIISFFMFAPWGIFVLTQHTGASDRFWIEKLNTHDLINLPALLFSGYEKGWHLEFKHLTALSIFLYLLLFYSFTQKYKNSEIKSVKLFRFIFFIPIILVLLITFFVKPIFYNRYLIFTVPYLLFLLILSFERIRLRTLSIFLILTIFYISVYYDKKQVKLHSKENIKPFVYKLKNIMRKGDIILVKNGKEYPLIKYYFPHHKVYIYGESYRDIPPYVGKILIPSSVTRFKDPIYPQRAFLISSNNRYEVVASY